MTRATSFLAIATLAVVLDDGFAARFITDRAARTSAGIGLGHCHSPAGSLLIGTARDQADFGLAKTSMPRPVSRKDFRLERTAGHPCLMPLAIPLPASSSSWVTVSRTMSSYSSIWNVTRL